MKNLTNNNSKNTLRLLMLDLYEVGESINVFAYAMRLMIALKDNKITSEQYKLLCGDLQNYCERNKLETSNEIVSLF